MPRRKPGFGVSGVRPISRWQRGRKIAGIADILPQKAKSRLSGDPGIARDRRNRENNPRREWGAMGCQAKTSGVQWGATWGVSGVEWGGMGCNRGGGIPNRRDPSPESQKRAFRGPRRKIHGYAEIVGPSADRGRSGNRVMGKDNVWRMTRNTRTKSELRRNKRHEHDAAG